MALAIGVAMAAGPALAQQTSAPPAAKPAGEEPNICIKGSVLFSEAKYEEALTSLRTCVPDTSLPRYDRALGYGHLIAALAQLGRHDERIVELRKITAAPFSEWSEFTPATLAMQKMRESEIFVGMTQPAFILELATELFDKGDLDAALAETSRAIRVAKATRADMLLDEVDAWMVRAMVLQVKGDAMGMTTSMLRAYIRGGNHQAIDQLLSSQAPELQDKFKQLRETMLENAPKVAYKNAWWASLGQPFNPNDAEIRDAVDAVSIAEIQEDEMLGPPGL